MSGPKRRVMVHADNPTTARQMAAEKLGIHADLIEISESTNGRYFAEPKNQTGQATIEISPDELLATVVRVSKPVGGAKTPTATNLRDQIHRAGVRRGLLPEALQQIADTCRAKGSLDEPVVVARGMAPGHGGKTGQAVLVRHGQRVHRGVTLATRETAPAEGSGYTVTGRELTGEAATSGELQFGDHVGIEDKGRKLVAAMAGFVAIDGDILSIRPILEVSPDLMEVRLNVFPPAEGERPLAYVEIIDLLEQAGVVYGIDGDKIRATLRVVEDTGEPARNVVIAVGVRPEDGQDARVEFHVDLSEKVGVEREDGSLDYYERNTVTNVKAGEPLATIVPSSPSRPGKTVTGEERSARDGIEAPTEAGEGVETSEDGRLLRAATDGCIQLRGHTLVVLDTFEVRGDVDFSTGNLDCNGFLKVYGTVRSTFSVRARSHIHVFGAVEDARVDAGGDVVVAGGVLMKGREEAQADDPRARAARKKKVEPEDSKSHGLVTAQGIVQASFATNAQLMAERDIWIKNEAMNCALHANGKVIAVEGKGAIIGGRIRATLGVEARQLGSDAGIRTDVVIDVSPEVYRELEQIEEEIVGEATEMERINLAIQGGLLQRAEGASVKKKEAILKLLRYYKVLKHHAIELARRKQEIQDLMGISKRSKVVVFGTVFPGVTIRIHDRQYKVDKVARCYRFYWDPNEDKITRAPVMGKH